MPRPEHLGKQPEKPEGKREMLLPNPLDANGAGAVVLVVLGGGVETGAKEAEKEVVKEVVKEVKRALGAIRGAGVIHAGDVTPEAGVICETRQENLQAGNRNVRQGTSWIRRTGKSPELRKPRTRSPRHPAREPEPSRPAPKRIRKAGPEDARGRPAHGPAGRVEAAGEQARPRTPAGQPKPGGRKAGPKAKHLLPHDGMDAEGGMAAEDVMDAMDVEDAEDATDAEGAMDASVLPRDVATRAVDAVPDLRGQAGEVAGMGIVLPGEEAISVAMDPGAAPVLMPAVPNSPPNRHQT